MNDTVAHLLYFGGVVVAAAAFALIEIQVEGPAGWAQNLPTWRVTNPFLRRIFDRLLPGRPLTGYHIWILVFMAIVVHLPFAMGLPWTMGGQLRAVAFFLFFWVAEDFLWFVLNPHFGLRKFRPEHIAWHQKAWWWLAPRDYWISLAVAIALYVCSRSGPHEIIVAMKQ